MAPEVAGAGVYREKVVELAAVEFFIVEERLREEVTATVDGVARKLVGYALCCDGKKNVQDPKVKILESLTIIVEDLSHEKKRGLVNLGMGSEVCPARKVFVDMFGIISHPPWNNQPFPSSRREVLAKTALEYVTTVTLADDSCLPPNGCHRIAFYVKYLRGSRRVLLVVLAILCLKVIGMG
ncbi:hypothetical protein D5086_026089 [Populus alba]|uniref:Uncharacterized protein n=1 Tax=Populus alba TaxID=43335 RepID=A0ACC4B0Y9_POPAL